MSINEAAKPLPEIFVSSSLIKQRINLFIKNKHQLLSADIAKRGIKSEETRSVWYPKAHIETWLSEMEHTGANGMRIYLGEYEFGEEGDAGFGRPFGQICLLMVLTREGNEPGALKNIIYENEPDYSQRIISTQSTRSIIENSLSDSGSVKQFNFGGYCPPLCPKIDDEFPDVP